MRIVIVEDEILIREGVVRLTGRISPDYVFVGMASNGREGLEMIFAQRPDLVITDIKMPDMDGMEMLQKVREQGCSCIAIVLTAYSEFSSAQQAVRLGVIEFLLKPIVMADFIQALRRAECMARQNAENGLTHPEALRSLRMVYRSAMDGLQVDYELRTYLANSYAVDTDGLFTLCLLYAGNGLRDVELNAAHELKRKLCLLRGNRARLIELPDKRMLAVVDAGGCDAIVPLLPEYLDSTGFIAGYAQFHTLNALQDTVAYVSGRMDMAIALDKRYMDIRKLTDERLYHTFTYPISVENRACAAVWAHDPAAVEREFASFFALAFSTAHPHRQHEIKENFVRLLWSLLSNAVECGYPYADTLERQAVLEQAMGAITREELYTARNTLLTALRMPRPAIQTQPGETISRTCAMIHEYYTSGITLEEIAGKLRVTPEYLSHQFHKEIGVNYSAYIRSLRIEKAKELLKTTELKVYEVARRVGYTDSKYFTRVFKSETGCMPCGYRSRP